MSNISFLNLLDKVRKKHEPEEEIFQEPDYSSVYQLMFTEEFINKYIMMANNYEFEKEEYDQFAKTLLYLYTNIYNDDSFNGKTLDECINGIIYKVTGCGCYIQEVRGGREHDLYIFNKDFLLEVEMYMKAHYDINPCLNYDEYQKIRDEVITLINRTYKPHLWITADMYRKTGTINMLLRLMHSKYRIIDTTMGAGHMYEIKIIDEEG